MINYKAIYDKIINGKRVKANSVLVGYKFKDNETSDDWVDNVKS